MAGQGETGLRRIVSATFNSIAGLEAAWKNEAAFRQECALTIVLVPAAFWVGQSAIELILLIGSCLLVLIVELLNTAVEATVDRVGMEHHQLSGRAKDLGSAAVLVSLLLLGLVWGLIGWANLA
jgi:diacylglycerol kinase (ATP)